MNPAHERTTAAIVARDRPGLYVSASSDVLPELREYERFSTTVLNAYIGPLVGSYLQSLAGELRARGHGGTLLIVTSSGGVASPERAARFPVHTVLSGPAGGVAAAVHVGEQLGLRNIITYDMGGTSTDVCLIEDLEPPLTGEQMIAGYPNRLALRVHGDEIEVDFAGSNPQVPGVVNSTLAVAGAGVFVALKADVAAGSVSHERAREGYGVSLRDNGTVDSAATVALRSRLAATRHRVAIVADERDPYAGVKGRHRCFRVAPALADKLGLEAGELVELRGRHPAPLRGWVRLDPTALPDVIGLDAFARAVLGAGAGHTVEVRMSHDRGKSGARVCAGRLGVSDQAVGPQASGQRAREIPPWAVAVLGPDRR